MVDVSEELLTKAKKMLVDLHDKWGKTETGVTLGRAVDMKGVVSHGINYNMCHAWVTHAFSAYTQRKDKNFLILSCHSKLRSKAICSPEAHEAIILWMASDECPFSKYILNRDDKDSLLNGGIIILCGPDGGIENSNHAMWMCKVLRYGVEGAKALDVWYELYKSGVNPLLALFVATYVRSVKGATFGFTGAEGHSAVFTGGYWGTYKSGASPEDLLIGEVNPQASNTTEVFGKPKQTKKIDRTDPEQSKEMLRKFCKPIKKSDGWGGEVDGNAASKEEFVKNVLDWQAQLEKKVGEVGLVEQFKRAVKPKAPGKTTVYLEADL